MDVQSDTTVATREELLSAYAAGSTSPGLSLLCAAHLTLSPKGRRYVDGLDELGGALMASDTVETSVEACAPPSLEAMLARIDAEEDAAPVAAPQKPNGVSFESGPLPAPIARAAGIGPEGIAFKDLPWRFRLPGISEHTLEGFDAEKVSLLRAPGRARAGAHP